jgi:hypothetical protein
MERLDKRLGHWRRRARQHRDYRHRWLLRARQFGELLGLRIDGQFELARLHDWPALNDRCSVELYPAFAEIEFINTRAQRALTSCLLRNSNDWVTKRHTGTAHHRSAAPAALASAIELSMAASNEIAVQRLSLTLLETSRAPPRICACQQPPGVGPRL